jgi:hypothetical protein
MKCHIFIIIDVMKKYNRIVNCNYMKLSVAITALFLSFLLQMGSLFAQTDPASPANWLYPEGNLQALRRQFFASKVQTVDSFMIKWTNPSISGDVKPLIGNIINNKRLSSDFRWAQNEITAVIGNNLVIIDAAGRTLKKSLLPAFVKDVSVLFDTLSEQINYFLVSPVVMGFETIETANTTDTLSFSYIGGYNHKADTVAILKRLALDLREFSPNIFASIKPVIGKRDGNNILVYSVVNMSNPDTSATNVPPYFRGMALFNTGKVLNTFPLPDIGDDSLRRITASPFLNISQPSLWYNDMNYSMLMPSYPDIKINTQINNSVIGLTQADRSYLIGLNLNGQNISTTFNTKDLTSNYDTNYRRPQTRPYYIDIMDANNPTDSLFILLAEEYTGIDGSVGRSKLHLLDKNGNFILGSNPGGISAFNGGQNHFWGISTGDMDGVSNNELLPYFPNNPGKELIITQSTRDFAYPGSKLQILRYRTGNQVPKASPPNSYLFEFDTVATQKISGWIAAVNDLDAKSDLKDEIVIADGSKLLVLNLRNYEDYLFRTGIPFDTLYFHEFRNQTISSVAIADLEGDELNELIVTTFDSLYVIGSPLKNTFVLMQPKIQSTPPDEYCPGDTVNFKWRNIIPGINTIAINYHTSIIDGKPASDTIKISGSIQNNTDTVSFQYEAESRLAGTEGRFFLYNAETGMLLDSTAYMIFNMPAISLNIPTAGNYIAGSNIKLDGTMICADSVFVDYSYDTANWFNITSVDLLGINSGTYYLTSTLPCPQFFNCTAADSDSLIYFRSRGGSAGVNDTSNIISLRVLPYPFPVSFDTTMYACPTKEFYWSNSMIPFPCDTVTVSASADGGQSFTLIDRVSASEGKYSWRIPLNLPKSLIMRFCCESSCIRLDTLIGNYQPKYIGIVAPNPFQPPYETLEVVYKVPEETNVTIRIFDAANRLVAEPVKNELRKPDLSYCDRWNGELPDGGYAANGIYYLSLEMSNGQKEVYHVFIKK